MSGQIYLRVGFAAIMIAANALVGHAERNQPHFIRMEQAQIAVDGGLSRGLAFGDYNADNLPDLVVANTIGQPEFFYRNVGHGGFKQVHEVGPTLNAGWSEGVNWVDVDNDGDLDLFVVRTADGHRLYRNNGGELDLEATNALAGTGVAGSMACWADFDGDSWLDVFIVNRQGQHDALFRNLDGVRFERQWHGPAVNNGGDGRACGLGDIDGDGDLDLYVGNFIDYTGDRPASQRNFLYRNLGGFRFEEVTTGSHVTSTALTYGISFVDFDDDDDADLFVSNIGSRDRNWLFVNDGSGDFELSASLPARDDPAPSKGHTWGDLDNDGDLDLYVANGTEGTVDVRNFLYVNDGEGEFVRLLDEAPTDDAHISAGVAWADVDRDGDLDLAVANWADADQDNDFYRNETIDREGDTAGRHWIALVLRGVSSNRMGVGAKAIATTVIGGERKRQIRWLLPGTGYASQNEPIVHFGLADAVTVQQFEIVWPSGQRDVEHDVQADKFYIATEAGGLEAMQRPISEQSQDQ